MSPLLFRSSTAREGLFRGDLSIDDTKHIPFFRESFSIAAARLYNHATRKGTATTHFSQHSIYCFGKKGRAAKETHTKKKKRSEGLNTTTTYLFTLGAGIEIFACGFSRSWSDARRGVNRLKNADTIENGNCAHPLSGSTHRKRRAGRAEIKKIYARGFSAVYLLILACSSTMASDEYARRWEVIKWKAVGAFSKTKCRHW